MQIAKLRNDILVCLYPGKKYFLLDENKTESFWLKEADAGCRHTGQCSYVGDNGESNSYRSYRKLGYRIHGEVGG